jgi:hypothetical protein
MFMSIIICTLGEARAPPTDTQRLRGVFGCTSNLY